MDVRGLGHMLAVPAMITHPTHRWQDHYCQSCGTLDRAVNGVPEAPCAKAPVPEPKPTIDWSRMIRSGVAS